MIPLSLCITVYMSVHFCILCKHKLYMYTCICLLSVVGTAVLNRCTGMCSIIVLYFLQWMKEKSNKQKGMERQYPWIDWELIINAQWVMKVIWKSLVKVGSLFKSHVALCLNRNGKIEVEWITKTENRKMEFLTVGKICKALLRLNCSRLQRVDLSCSWVSAGGGN